MKTEEIKELERRRADAIGSLIACVIGIVGLVYMLIYLL